MSTKPLKSITFPNLSDTYTVPQIDDQLTTAGKAADAKKTGDELSQLKEDFNAVTEENAFEIELLKGYWANGTAVSRYDTSSTKFRSIRNTLEPGEYTITFEEDVRMIRICLDGNYCQQSVDVDAGEPFSFRVLTTGFAGFSFAKRVDGSSVDWVAMWVQLEKSGVTLGKCDASAVDAEVRKHLADGISPDIVKVVKTKDLLNGYFNNGVYTTSTSRITTWNLYPVHKGDIVLLNNKDICVTFLYFDSTRTRFAYSNPVSSEHIGGATVQADVYFVENDGYLGFTFYDRVKGSSTSISRADYDNIMSIVDLHKYSLVYASYTGQAMLANMKAKLLNRYIHGQDGCIIGDKLYSFDDGVSEPSSIIEVDLPTAESRIVGNQQLGHCNSVDYNDDVSTLITYGKNGTNQPTIVLYKNPDMTSGLRLTDSDCTIIPLYDASSFMNTSGALCFGEAPCFCYFVEGVYSDASQTINTNRKIYKILLGMGNNDLSSGGYGTFTSGKEDDEYNGTCKIIKTYTGEVVPGVHCFANANSLWTPQGLQYNGYLFLAYGTAGNNYLKISLDDHAGKYTAVNNYHFEVYDASGNIIPCEPELLAIKGTKLYCGVTNRSTHDTYLYETDLI